LSENENPESNNPKLKAGEKLIGMCPICQMGFEEPVPTNIKLTCPNPQCEKTFLVMVFD